MAIGMLTTAFSVSGVLFPPLLARLTAHHGWRRASLLSPVLTALVVLPI